MFSMIGHAIFGLLVGLCARYLTHGHEGLIVTMLLGIAGGWLGGSIGRWLGWYGEGHPAGFLMSLVGAFILFFVVSRLL